MSSTSVSDEITMKEESQQLKRGILELDIIEPAEQSNAKRKRRSTKNKNKITNETDTKVIKLTGSGKRKNKHPQKAASKIEPNNSKDIRFTLEIGESTTKKLKSEEILSDIGINRDFFGQITSKGIDFERGNQKGKRHDEGDAYGYFESYDNFNEGVGGPTDKPRRIHILLPRNYEESDGHYSVIYVHDANTTFWPEPPPKGNLKTWALQKSLSTYTGSDIRKVIIVAIHTNDRIYEYTHAPLRKEWRHGGLNKYTQYLADHLKPWVDKYYKTLPSPKSTAIMGASAGGLASFYISCIRPDAFGIGLCWSPAFSCGLDFDLNVNAELKLVDSELFYLTSSTLQNKAIRPKIYLYWGMYRTGNPDEDKLEATITYRGQEAAEILKQKFKYIEGEDLIINEDPNGVHEENSWVSTFIDVLKFFFPANK